MIHKKNNYSKDTCIFNLISRKQKNVKCKIINAQILTGTLVTQSKSKMQNISHDCTNVEKD